MKSSFRLYSDDKFNFNSSIFDLIDGDKETKQTKGLAYLLFSNPEVVFEICNRKDIKSAIKQIFGDDYKLENIANIDIVAEKVTVSRKRADIVIKILKNEKPFLAIVIEAKSIKVSVNQESIKAQIENYLDDIEFPELTNYKKLGIILTKYQYCVSGITSITWHSLIETLILASKNKDNKNLINQFVSFVTGVDKSMKYYEKEVLSIPAGKSLKQVEKYLIYECPDTKDYNYKKPIFITFRNSGGGVMLRLFKIEDIIVLSPDDRLNLENLENSNIQNNIKKRLLAFIAESPFQDEFSYDKRFYILSETENIELNHKPKPERNNAKFTYYKLGHILTEEIVTPESKQ